MRFKRGCAVLTSLALIAATLFVMPGSAMAAPRQIVAFGDSLTAGYGLGPGEGFAERLQAALKAKGEDVVVTNAGVSGDTTSGGLSRLDWSVPDGTDLVILELGANDMLRGVAPEIARKNLDTMLGKLKARNIPVVLAGMRAAPNLGPDYAKRFDAIYPDLAKTYGATLYPFFLEGIAAQSGMLQADGMHPNTTGVDVIVKGILPTIEAALAALPREG